MKRRLILKSKTQRTWREIYMILKKFYDGFEDKGGVTFRQFRKNWLYEKRHGAFRPHQEILADIELEKARERTAEIRRTKCQNLKPKNNL